MSAERDIDRRSPREVAASLAGALAPAASGRRIQALVGTGQFSPHRGHSRVGVLRLEGEGPPRLVWDRFYPDEALPELRRELTTSCDVLEGELDTMFATDWTLAWTVPPSPLRVYDRDGAIAVGEGDGLRLVRSRHLVPAGDVRNVRAWVSDDWVNRGVSLVLRSGERLEVAGVKDEIALVDPTYDGINLMCEAAWAAQMGKALARGLGVPYVAGDSLLA